MPFAPRLLAASALVLVLAVSGCSETGSGASRGPSLADTKSPVQLLRNEAADRIPSAVVQAVFPGQDQSKACKTEAEDPEGRERSWFSSVSVQLAADADLEVVTSKLLLSFVSDGWERSEVGSSGFRFTRDDSAADVQVTTEPADEELGAGARIQVAVNGPCVLTAGADSDEVRRLEAGSASK